MGVDYLSEVEQQRRFLRQKILAHAVKLGQGFDRQGKPMSWIFDCRELLLMPDTLRLISSHLWPLINSFSPDIVLGKGVSGGPLVAAALLEAERNGYSMKGLIIREERKAFGRRQQIEGPAYHAGARAIVVDDVVNSGATLDEIVRIVAPFGLKVTGVTCVVDNQVPRARRVLSKYGLELKALFTATELGLCVRVPNESCKLSRTWSSNFSQGVSDSAIKPLVVAAAEGYCVSRGQYVTFVRQNDGVVLWNTRLLSPVIAACTAAGGRFTVLGFDDGLVQCFRSSNGLLMWSSKLEKKQRLFVPLAEDKIVLAVCDDVSSSLEIVGLSLEQGDVVFRIVVPGKGVTENSFASCRPSGGEELAKYGIGQYWEDISFSPPWSTRVIGFTLGSQGQIYGTEDGMLWCLDQRLGTKAWSLRIGLKLESGPTLIGQIVLISTPQRSVVAVDAITGELVWMTRLPSSLSGSPQVLDNNRRIVAVPTEMEIFLLDLDSGDVLLRQPHQGRFATDGQGNLLLAAALPDGTLTLLEKLALSPGIREEKQV
jgi:orotate phosphoribosyltransferase